MYIDNKFNYRYEIEKLKSPSTWSQPYSPLKGVSVAWLCEIAAITSPGANPDSTNNNNFIIEIQGCLFVKG